MEYIKKHWRGELSLPLAFWVNLVGLGLLARPVIAWVGEYGIEGDPLVAARLAAAIFLLSLFVIYPWQIVGTWRSASRRRRETARGVASTVVQILIVIGLIYTVSTVAASWSGTKETLMLATGHDPVGEYAVGASPDGELLFITGPLSLGISDDARSVLENNPTIGAVALSSIGGRLYEGHELARLFIEYQLDTYAVDGCYSACVLAFAAGQQRYLVVGTTLGFHQPGAGTSGFDPYFDQDGEQAKDIAYYRSRGFDETFLERIFVAAHDDLWYPTMPELLAANVIHGQVEASSIGLGLPAMDSSDIDNVFAEILMYATIKEYAPEQYQQLIDAVGAAAEKGTTSAEIQVIAAKYMAAIADPLFGKAQDATMIRFVRSMNETMAHFNRTSPAQCVAWLFPDAYGHTNVASAIPKDLQYEMLEVLGQIIIDANTTVAPEINMDAAMVIIEDLYVQFADELSYLDPSILSTNDDYSAACSGAIAFYSAFLEYDDAVAGNALRFLFWPE